MEREFQKPAKIIVANVLRIGVVANTNVKLKK